MGEAGGGFYLITAWQRAIPVVGVLFCLGMRLSSAVEFSLVKHLLPSCLSLFGIGPNAAAQVKKF